MMDHIPDDKIKPIVHQGDKYKHLIPKDVTDPEMQEELRKQLVALDEQGKLGYTDTDPGVRARLALEQKLAKMKKRRRNFWLFMLVLIVVLGGVGYWLSTQVKTFTDEYTRSCSVRNSGEAGGQFMTGQREYSYSFKSLFGFRLIDESSVTEKTFLHVRGDKTMVIGLTGKDAETLRIGQGERGDRQPLQVADTYIFIINDQVEMISYQGFCR